MYGRKNKLICTGDENMIARSQRGFLSNLGFVVIPWHPAASPEHQQRGKNREQQQLEQQSCSELIKGAGLLKTSR
jgi:hypothetical protein